MAMMSLLLHYHGGACHQICISETSYSFLLIFLLQHIHSGQYREVIDYKVGSKETFTICQYIHYICDFQTYF